MIAFGGPGRPRHLGFDPARGSKPWLSHDSTPFRDALQFFYSKNRPALPLSGTTQPSLASALLSGPRSGCTDLTALNQLSNLEVLDIGRKNGFSVGTDLEPLKSLTALKALRIKGSKEVDLAPILGLESLNQIVARSIPISDLSPFLPLIRCRLVGVALIG